VTAARHGGRRRRLCLSGGTGQAGQCSEGTASEWVEMRSRQADPGNAPQWLRRSCRGAGVSLPDHRLNAARRAAVVAAAQLRPRPCCRATCGCSISSRFICCGHTNSIMRLHWRGRPYPYVRGTAGKETPSVTLNLQPGELVRRAHREEIMRTLNVHDRTAGSRSTRRWCLLWQNGAGCCGGSSASS